MLLCYFTLKMLFTQYSIIFTQNMIYVQKCNPYTDQYVEYSNTGCLKGD